MKTKTPLSACLGFRGQEKTRAMKQKGSMTSTLVLLASISPLLLMKPTRSSLPILLGYYYCCHSPGYWYILRRICQEFKGLWMLLAGRRRQNQSKKNAVFSHLLFFPERSSLARLLLWYTTYSTFQSTPPCPKSSRASFAFLKHSDPMNGSGFRVADRGEGWAHVITRCFEESIRAPFFCRN